MKTVTLFHKLMNFFLLLSAVGLSATFIGCGGPKVWTKPGLNQETFDRDFAQCQREASSSTQTLNFSDYTGLERDVMRDNLVEKCMYSKGYKLKER